MLLVMIIEISMQQMAMIELSFGVMAHHLIPFLKEIVSALKPFFIYFKIEIV